MKARLKQRLEEIKGLRNNLQDSTNVSQILSHLNYSLQQYDAILDDNDVLSLELLKNAKPTQLLQMQQRSPQKQMEYSSYLDPYIVINQTKKVRNKKEKERSISTLPRVLDQLVENKKKAGERVSSRKGSIKKGITNSPKFILPKQIRNNPFAQVQAIHEDQINEGMINLINKGLIQKDIDISPAFEKGSQILATKQAEMHDNSDKKIKLYIPLRQQNPCLLKLTNTSEQYNKKRSNSIRETKKVFDSKEKKVGSNNQNIRYSPKFFRILVK